MSDFDLGDLSPAFQFLQELYLLAQLQGKDTRITISLITGLIVLAFAGWLFFDPAGATSAFNNGLHFLAQQEVKQFFTFGAGAARKYRKHLAERQKLLDAKKED